MLFVSSISPFINNIPIVAFRVPYVKEWLDEKQLPVSKYIVPLCFATVLSGMITVVGTSSNLLLLGLISEASLPALSYKDFLFLGILVTVIGVIHLRFYISYRYQCNLMVYGPNNYAFTDFFEVGFPLTVLYSTAWILFILVSVLHCFTFVQYLI
jgi:di/tricarboxylate transporter